MKPFNLIINVIYTIVVLILFGFITTSNAQNETAQETRGSQSPIVNAKGNVSIIYRGLPKEQREFLYRQLGNNQKMIDRLLKELNAKDAALAESKVEIEKWVKKYEELKIRIAELPANDERATKAKEALIDGDLKKAESVVTFRGGIFQGGVLR